MLLRTCEQITVAAEIRSLYLHARTSDIGARAFYLKAGYLVAGTDTKMSAIWHHIVPRVLLYKQLSLAESLH